MMTILFVIIIYLLYIFKKTSNQENGTGNNKFYTSGQKEIALIDWFAGQALYGMLSSQEKRGTYEETAKEAYLYAKTMIKEKSKKSN